MTVQRYVQLPPPPNTSPALAGNVFLSPWAAWFNAIWNTLNTLTVGPSGMSPGPADICLWVEGLPNSSEVLLGFVMDRTVVFPSKWTGSVALSQAAATSSAVFTLKQNATSIGTITFAASGTTGTFAGTGATFSSGQVLFIVGPSSQDATLANVSITLQGIRQN